jgi:hypothetical protein
MVLLLQNETNQGLHENPTAWTCRSDDGSTVLAALENVIATASSHSRLVRTDSTSAQIPKVARIFLNIALARNTPPVPLESTNVILER